MSVTVQQVLNGAYAKSTKNVAGEIATEATELLGVVNRVVRKYFAFMARQNPLFIAKTASVAFAGAGWARPADAESVLRIESGSTEIVVVPFDDKQAEATLPAVYRLAGTYITAGNAGDPTSGTLTFTYARRPTDAAGVSSTIDTGWPDQFNEILMLEVAVYLARKDNRLEELQALAGELDEWVELFRQFLEHETANERRRFDLVNRFQAQVRRPVVSMHELKP